MTWRAWSSDADGGVRTSILTAQTTPAPDLTRRVTPQNPRSQHYHHDFAEALNDPTHSNRHVGLLASGSRRAGGSARPGCVVGRARLKHGSATSAPVGRLGDFTRWPLRGTDRTGGRQPSAQGRRDQTRAREEPAASAVRLMWSDGWPS